MYKLMPLLCAIVSIALSTPSFAQTPDADSRAFSAKHFFHGHVQQSRTIFRSHGDRPYLTLAGGTGAPPEYCCDNPNADGCEGLVDFSTSSCEPVPDRCMEASASGQQLIGNFAHSGAYSAASQAYCATFIAIEINKFCAYVYRNEYKCGCADLAAQQADANQSALPQIEATISDLSTDEIRQACAWEQ